MHVNRHFGKESSQHSRVCSAQNHDNIKVMKLKIMGGESAQVDGAGSGSHVPGVQQCLPRLQQQELSMRNGLGLTRQTLWQHLKG